ncbi:hypothetical protein evm_015026 [Chilo suppressalis]|nr:hypothetical protein evm_015026 [Chilo suppressalis]
MCNDIALHNDNNAEIRYSSKVRPPPYRKVDVECAEAGDSKPHVTAHNLCGDLNRGDIPRNPMGQSVDGEPYPFELIRNHTLRFLSRALPALRNDDSLPRVTRLPATPAPTRPDPGYIQHNGQREVCVALQSFDVWKACGLDGIPAVVLENQELCAFTKARILWASPIDKRGKSLAIDLYTTPPASPARPDPGYIQHNGQREVCAALQSFDVWKASGLDGIPAVVLENQKSCSSAFTTAHILWDVGRRLGEMPTCIRCPKQGIAQTWSTTGQ